MPADPAEQVATIREVQRVHPSIARISLGAVDGDLSRLSTGCDEQYEFEFALDLLLDALEPLHQAGWHSHRG